jgi:uncharacterized protein (DUF302 family)
MSAIEQDRAGETKRQKEAQMTPERAERPPTGGRTASHHDERVRTKLSPSSVADTLARLSTVVAERGMKVFAVIDHSGEAAASGLELRDTKVVLFGNPKAGTPVMQAAPLAALDLPLKVLIWADGDRTNVSYTSPGELADRYDLSDELAARLAGIDAVTDAAIAT